MLWCLMNLEQYLSVFWAYSLILVWHVSFAYPFLSYIAHIDVFNQEQEPDELMENIFKTPHPRNIFHCPKCMHLMLVVIAS